MEQFGEEKNRATWALHYAQVKAAIVQPKKTHEATVDGHTPKGKPYHYTYKYADLADVDKAVMDAIRKTEDKDNKPILSYFFELDNGTEGVAVQTVIIDAETGFMIKTNKVWFKNYNVGDAQKTASLISYAKRYSLSAAFGIASEDDDDAQSYKDQIQPQADSSAINVIWNSAVNGDTKAKEWIKSKHDQATTQIILTLSTQYREDQQKAKKAERAKELRAKHEEERKKAQEQQRAEDEAIKKIVDGNKSSDDPDGGEYAGQQDLFSDIVGG